MLKPTITTGITRELNYVQYSLRVKVGFSRLDLTRRRLVTQFTRLEEPLIESFYFNDVQEITSLLQRVRDLWLRIANLNSAILKQLLLEKRIWELAYQSQLEEYASKLFSLGDEALCPPQMKLFNGPGNVGFFCDCSNSVEMIYSNITGTCYVPYFQVRP